MKSPSKHNVEALFSCLGSTDVPICETHYFALRRTLLNSKYFAEERRAASEHKTFLFFPFVASGVLVLGLFVLFPDAPSEASYAERNKSVSIQFVEVGAENKPSTESFFDDRPPVWSGMSSATESFSTSSLALMLSEK